ncbi:MAG: SHOCT domain-containing protein [Anaerolineales bacterium]|nr:SHOCT domain-containing protein [Chloroflexota bacterium]MBL6983864.1 SHOCT domain-containing protein [Anaerolineales bacterium]
MWYGHGFGWGGMIFGGIMMLLFWGGLIALVIWGVRSVVLSNNTQRSASAAYSLTAREILDQRYARGDINRDEYAAMKGDLSH